MCYLTTPSPCIWVIWKRIPEEKRTDSDKKFWIEWERLPCGDFSSEANAKAFLNGWQESIDNPGKYKIEEHMLDWLLRCH